MKKNLKYLLPLATLLLLLSACQEPEMEVFSSHPSVPSTTVLPKPSPTLPPRQSLRRLSRRSLSRVLARRSGKPSSSSS